MKRLDQQITVEIDMPYFLCCIVVRKIAAQISDDIIVVYDCFILRNCFSDIKKITRSYSNEVGFQFNSEFAAFAERR